MKITVILMLFVFAGLTFGQGKSNETIAKQLKTLSSSKSITITYDKDSYSTKVMAVAENFDQKEAAKAGVLVMNFAMAYNYMGKSFAASPDKIKLAFWIISKRPQFAAAHGLKVTVGQETVDLGDSRYSPKPSENMEYLTFDIALTDLKKIAVTGAKLRLGNADLTFTKAQAALLNDLLTVLTP